MAFSPLRSDLVFYPPVYPYFVGAIFRAFGTMRAVLWAQVVLGALLVPVVGRAGALAFGRRAGSSPPPSRPPIRSSSGTPPTTGRRRCSCCWLWGAIERTLAADARGSRGTAASAGLLWGLATLTRELVPLPRADRGLVDVAWPRANKPAPAPRAHDPRPDLRGDGPRRRSRPRRPCSPGPVDDPQRRSSCARSSRSRRWAGSTSGRGTRRSRTWQIYEVLATKGGAVEQDRYCREMARETIAARQPTWIFEKLVEQMPEFWKAGSEVLDHIRGERGLRPASRAASSPSSSWWSAVSRGARSLPRRAGSLSASPAPRGCCCCFSPPTTPRTSWPTPLTRFRLPVLPIVFMVAAAFVVGRREGPRLPRGGWRLVCSPRWPSPLSRRSLPFSGSWRSHSAGGGPRPAAPSRSGTLAQEPVGLGRVRGPHAAASQRSRLPVRRATLPSSMNSVSRAP